MWSHKKVTKESDWGEALRQRLSWRGADPAEAPAFEPPSPQPPLPAAVAPLGNSRFLFGLQGVMRHRPVTLLILGTIG